MQLIDRVERTIAKTGAELRHTALFGLKAVTIKANEKYAIFGDTDDLNTMSALASAEAHECGHVATGSVYSFEADECTLLRAEMKADRYVAHKFLPVRNIAGGHSDFVFPAPNGKKMDLTNFRKRYYYVALKSIGVRPLAPYSRGHRFEPDYLHQVKKPDLLRTSK